MLQGMVYIVFSSASVLRYVPNMVTILVPDPVFCLSFLFIFCKNTYYIFLPILYSIDVVNVVRYSVTRLVLVLLEVIVLCLFLKQKMTMNLMS